MTEGLPHEWRTSETSDLFEAILSLRTLDEALPYHEVATRTGASTTTVTRVAHWLKRGADGYRLVLDRRR